MADGVFGAVDHVSSIFLPFGATSPQGQRIYGISACLLAPDLRSLLLLCDMGAIYGAQVEFQGLKLSNISWKHWTQITADDQWGVPMAMDVEGMALDNRTGELLLSSERPSHFYRLPVPWQSFVSPGGNVTKALWLPHQPSFVEENEVSNRGLEAFTASANGDTFLAGVEGSLENDDPAVRRIYQVDSTGRSIWSGFLMVETFPSHPLGLTELAAVTLPASQSGGPHFLSLERRFSRAEGNDIRLYLLDMAGASNVSNCSAICDGPCDLRGENQCDLDELTPIQKHLIFQWTPSRLLGGLMVDNYEAMTIIPPQAVGYESVEELGGLAVLLVNDNNDNPRQIGTQFVLLRLPFATGEETRWPRIMLLLVVLPLLVALCSLCIVFLHPKARCRRCRHLLGRRVRHEMFEDDDPPVDAGVSKLGRPVDAV